MPCEVANGLLPGRGTLAVAATAAGHALRRSEGVVARAGTAGTGSGAACRTTLSAGAVGAAGFRPWGPGVHRALRRWTEQQAAGQPELPAGWRQVPPEPKQQAGPVLGAAGAGACAAGAGALGAAGPGAGVEGRASAAGAGALGAAAGAEALAAASGKALRSLRTTGASMVEEAERTNSPSSCSFVTASLEVIPSSLASSCTRTLATFLLSRSAPSQARTVYFLLRTPAAVAAEGPIAERNKVVIVTHSSLGTHRVSIRFLTRFQVGRLVLQLPWCLQRSFPA
jgi:hypothetical protein